MTTLNSNVCPSELSARYRAAVGVDAEILDHETMDGLIMEGFSYFLETLIDRGVVIPEGTDVGVLLQAFIALEAVSYAEKFGSLGTGGETVVFD